MPGKSAYWRKLRRKAWELSKERFGFLYPLIVGVVVFVLQWVVMGWSRAVEDLTPALISAAAAVIVALCVYVINIFRAASAVHANQLSVIAQLEREHDAAVGKAEKERQRSLQRIEALRTEFDETKHIQSSDGRTTVSLILPVRNASSKTVVGVSLRIDSIEVCRVDGITEPSPEWDDLRTHTERLVGVPLAIHNDPEQPPRKAVNINSDEMILFDICEAQASTHKVFISHAIREAIQSVGPNVQTTYYRHGGPYRELPGGRYRIQVKAQGMDVEPKRHAFVIDTGGDKVFVRSDS
jgi:hypothetical protein